MQPVVGVLSDNCKSSLGRRRPFIIGGCVFSSFAVMLFGWAKEVAGLVTTDGGVVVSSHKSLRASDRAHRSLAKRSQHARLTIALAIVSVFVM